MAKKNIKAWIKEHKQDIRDIAWYAAGAIVGIGLYVIANRRRHSNEYVVRDKTVKYILSRADKIEGKVWATGVIIPDSLTVDQLGELGRFIADNDDAGFGYTHFIAIGKPIDTK